ncbi:Sec-independent protein translocase protein TatB [Sodalis praecaptivus]|uniref:Sec-independent protein translocase protein TatB n=1 Tax=Sodalis praecaptivus TaxID=1239307 RepID=UPI0027F9DDDC|nr:Sec-independent protein translocase protein TatB [Sodalis praecaptivus]CAJ0996678.1 Sec-independent protein translocase protein TatB [Sodalis praecaptivus]
MFDIGFGELMLVFVIGLVVLGPERLPVAVRTVAGWIRAIRSMASTVQNELTQELKLQELQDSLKKVEEASKNNLSPELKASMEELREAAESMKKEFKGINSSALDPAEPHTIHNPLVTDPEALHDGVTPAEGDRQADAPPMTPADSVAVPAAQAAAPAAKAPAQGEPGSAASAPRPASSTSPLNNDR